MSYLLIDGDACARCFFGGIGERMLMVRRKTSPCYARCRFGGTSESEDSHALNVTGRVHGAFLGALAKGHLRGKHEHRTACTALLWGHWRKKQMVLQNCAPPCARCFFGGTSERLHSVASTSRPGVHGAASGALAKDRAARERALIDTCTVLLRGHWRKMRPSACLSLGARQNRLRGSRRRRFLEVSAISTLGQLLCRRRVIVFDLTPRSHYQGHMKYAGVIAMTCLMFVGCDQAHKPKDSNTDSQGDGAHQIGRYVITNVMNPNAAGEKPFTARLDTVTGRVDRLQTSPMWALDSSGKPKVGDFVRNEDGSIAGWIYWSQIPENIVGADNNPRVSSASD
jgi:hypothetical protein